MAEPSSSAKLLQRYRESVQADLKVLLNARRILLDHVNGAKNTIRRVSRSLLDASVAYGFHEVARAAAALESATDETLHERLDALLLLLDEIVSTGSEPRCDRVLLVGRLPVERQVMQSLPAQPGSEIFVAESALQAEELLLKHQFGLAVVNLCLPDIDGRLFVERLRRNPRSAELPVIAVAPALGPYLREELDALGATEVFARPLDVVAFARAAKALLAGAPPSETSAPLSRRRDSLTRLLTRHAFSVSFQRAVNLARSADLPIWFALIRADDLGPLVEVHGPRIQDEVLRRSARVLRDALPESDLCARWSADEFAILLLNRKQGDLPALGSRLLDRLASQTFEVGGDRPAQVSFSAGVVRVDPEASLRETALRATRLLSNGKAGGPAQLLFEDEQTLPPRRTALLVLPDDLVPSAVRHHLEEEGFVAVHQTSLDAAMSAAHAMDHLDLLLLDTSIAHEPGVSPLRALLSLPHLAETPVLLITESDDEEALAAGFREGAADYLTKPFSPSDLLGRIYFVLKRREVRRHSSDPPLYITRGALVDALVQVIRNRLASGESVDLPRLGSLQVEYREARMHRDESGRTVLIPPHNTVRLTTPPRGD